MLKRALVVCDVESDATCYLPATDTKGEVLGKSMLPMQKSPGCKPSPPVQRLHYSIGGRAAQWILQRWQGNAKETLPDFATVRDSTED